MKKIVFLLIFLLFKEVFAQQFVNRYPSNLDLHIYTVTDVLELDGAYYKAETESNNGVNFHSNIRIIKTDAYGNVIWAKRYDAGIDSSLSITSIDKTLDHQIILNGVLSNNNTYPPIGVALIKIDTSGAMAWSVLFPGFRGGYFSNNILQLADSSFLFDAESSASLNSCLIRCNANGTFPIAKVFQNMVYGGSNSITSMIQTNNELSFSFNYGEFVTTDTALNMITDRKYNLDETGAYFTHGVTANGDRVFIDDIIGGGSLNGCFRIFRTDAAGNLLWAKSLTIWKSFVSHGMFDLYDVTKGVRVFGDTSQNIVAHLLDEGGAGLTLTFDANGNYLTNKPVKGAELKLCADGDFLFASNLQFANALGIFGKVNHYGLNCDTLLDVLVASGTDSASGAATGSILSPVPVTSTSFPINSSSAAVLPVIDCSIDMGLNEAIGTDDQAQLFFPNPATDRLNIELPDGDSDFATSIFNVQGMLCKTSEQRTIDISDLPGGVYVLQLRTSKVIRQAKLIIE